ncbi:LacI family DNA-binding transcriptional regulator [Vibrio rumoiensis]|uniref:LacI family DNA-binding transcriptional regulator n=1 Tax=Vibrio rumoiensis TaxID=76258 RepID=UPI000D784A6F|nr:LacI family DNA-binding transcriptional regulator [Vibrio rumoiensis]
MATIKEVANSAGLSVTTVSRYLNNHPYISDEKRLKIEKAMADLDYQPSAVAQQMRGVKAFHIGVLVSRITNQYYAGLIDALEVTARKFGYSILIIQNHNSEGEEKRALELLKKKIIDGLVLCTVESDIDTLENYVKHGPIVLCNTHLYNTNIPSIHIDDEQATEEAINYLTGKGHKRIAYCTGGDFTSRSHGARRNKGFKTAMRKANQNIDYDLVFRHVHTLEDGEKIASQLASMKNEQRPSAIFTGSDEVACGVINILTKSGINVPDDIAVMGFDNQKISSLISVPVTTVHQPVDVLGKFTMEYLLAAIEGKSYVYDTGMLKTNMVIRNSA